MYSIEQKGGYGIGALFATQISRPFISFDNLKTPILEESSNSINNPMNERLKIYIKGPNVTIRNMTENIDLRVPYWTASFTSLILVFLFLIAQYFENKNNTSFETNKNYFALLAEDSDDSGNRTIDANPKISKQNTSLKDKNFLKKLILGEKNVAKEESCYMIVQISLFFLVFAFIQGYITVISRFLLTYLTKGPAKFDTLVFAKIQTIFWSFFIFSRFLATYLTFKIDSVVFFLSLLIINTFLCFTFLIPYFASYKLFYWLVLALLGLTSGPMIPSGLMVAKRILNFSSFVLSLFIVGLAVGGIVFQQIGGGLLDYFNDRKELLGFKNTNASYLIPYLSFFASFLALAFFLPIFILFKKNKI